MLDFIIIFGTVMRISTNMPSIDFSVCENGDLKIENWGGMDDWTKDGQERLVCTFCKYKPWLTTNSFLFMQLFTTFKFVFHLK